MIEDLPVNPAEPDEIAQVPTVSPGVTLARHAPLPAPRDLELPADSQRYLAAVLRFKWLVLAVAGGVTSLGGGGAGGVKPAYRGRAMGGVQVPGRPRRANRGGVPPPAAFRPRRRVEFEVTPPDEAVLLLAKAMKVSADVDGNFLRLDLSGHDAELVAATVNAVADRFVATAASLKRQKLTELTHI